PIFCLLDHIASADLLKRSALAAGVHQNLQSASLLRHQHPACLIGKGAGAGPGYGTVVRFKLPTLPGNDDLEIIQAIVEVAGAARALGNAPDIPQARAPHYLPSARWRRGDFRVGLTRKIGDKEARLGLAVELVGHAGSHGLARTVRPDTTA